MDVMTQKKNKFDIKKEATHAKLIQAGFEVFCEKGYSGASIDDIVTAAGYTKGAFYVHFKTKEQFILDLLKYRTISRSDMLSGLYELTRQNLTIEQIIHILITQSVEHVSKTPGWITVYVDFCNQAKQNEAAMEVYHDYYASWIDAIQHFIELLMEHNYLSAGTGAREKAKMFYAYFDGCLLHANLYREPLNPAVMTKAFLALLLGTR